MKSSGARGLWLSQIAATIMDGGSSPPSTDRLTVLVPPLVGTSINDGHVTAAIAFGEDRRDDFKAGQRFIIEEMLQVLSQQEFIAGDDQGWRWIKPLDGEFKIEVDGNVYSVHGQAERRMSRDRSMLGERSEDTGEAIGAPGLFARGVSVPFELDVVGPRGGHEKMKFQVHPLALVIPPMTEAEREALRASIDADGVKVPIVIYQKKILDGRNRGYFASILNKPVHIEEFTGTEEEAKRLVVTLNLHRRHLNTAQRALLIYRLFGKEAKAEAYKARIQSVGRPKKLEGKIPPISQLKQQGKWHEIAAKKDATGATKPDAVRMMEVVELAPDTSAAVDRGEISHVSKAHQKALLELRRPAPKLVQTIDPLSINKRLGRCVTEMQAIIKDSEGEAPTGTVPEISGKLDQIERLIPQVRFFLRSRNVI